MYRAIIIDDEKLIREGLVHYIDWENLGITIADVCEDGIKGMEAIGEHSPHIILSDIAMPNLDGLLLLEHTRSLGINCEVIFISAYSNFQYAQQALRLGAFDYLLKPIEAPTLEDSVRRCVEKLDSTEAKEDFPEALIALPKDGKMMNPYTRSALEIIHGRYSEALSLKLLSKEICVSPSHLSMVFKEDTGYSFSDYLYRYRMSVAGRLMQEGRHKIYEIGEMAGYPDMVQFSKRFKQFWGYSPRHWQREHK